MVRELKIQDDLDRLFGAKRSYLQVLTSKDTAKQKALFYRAFSDGDIVLNGFIEHGDLIILRDMINEVLGDGS